MKFFGVAFAAFFMAVSPARADVVYTYTGNAFTNFSGLFTCSPVCSLFGSFTLPSAFGPNIVFGDQTAPTVFSFTDGAVTLNQGNAFFDTFQIGTDGAGAINHWNFEISPFANGLPLFLSINTVNVASDASVLNPGAGPLIPFGQAINFDSPGTFSAEAVGGVPEPSTWAMLLIGFAALGFLADRRRRMKAALARA